MVPLDTYTRDPRNVRNVRGRNDASCQARLAALELVRCGGLLQRTHGVLRNAVVLVDG